jgi:sugar porter (SP) family MFS transporter
LNAELNQTDQHKNHYMVIISIIAALGGFLFGYDTAVISGTIELVANQFQLSTLMEGWFVSSALLGCISGVSIAGITSDKFGRKKTLILSAVLFFISALGCMLAPTQVSLISYRFVGGVGVGIASMLSPLYISEISAPQLRGRLVALYQFAITIGILTAYFANASLMNYSQSAIPNNTGWLYKISVSEVWRGMFGTEMIPALLFGLLLIFVPESPRWLCARGQENKSFKILSRISGVQTAKHQLKEIHEILARETPSIRQLLQPGFKRALIIGISLAILSQLTGINAIIYYGPRIFTQAGLAISDSLNSQVIIGIINVLFTLVAIWKIDKFGRKGLLLSGVSGMFIMLVTIGIFFQIESLSGILLLVPMLIYIACFAFSFGPVVWTLLSEIYPTHIRGRAMSIATFALWTGTFIIGQTVPWLLESVGASQTFWLFGVMCIPTILITWKLVPETKNKSLEDIERYWMNSTNQSQYNR